MVDGTHFNQVFADLFLLFCFQFVRWFDLFFSSSFQDKLPYIIFQCGQIVYVTLYIVSILIVNISECLCIKYYSLQGKVLVHFVNSSSGYGFSPGILIVDGNGRQLLCNDLC